MEAALEEEFAGLTDHQAQLLAALVHLLTSSPGVLILKDYAGLEAEAASATIEWALAVLLDAIRDPERRAGLGVVHEEAE